MSFDLLVLPLIGGFIFASKCNLTRASTKRVEGYRLFFYSALVGAILLLIAHTICYLVNSCNTAISANFHTFLQYPNIGKSMIAIVMGVTLWKPFNHFFAKKESWVRKDIERYGDHLDELFLRAFDEEKLIQITLRNGKVYVGRTLKAFEPFSQNEYVRILPIQSGFRNPTTHKVTYTANYDAAYTLTQSIQVLESQGVVIAVGDIVSASFFDQELYNNFASLKPMQSIGTISSEGRNTTINVIIG